MYHTTRSFLTLFTRIQNLENDILLKFRGVSYTTWQCILHRGMATPRCVLLPGMVTQGLRYTSESHLKKNYKNSAVYDTPVRPLRNKWSQPLLLKGQYFYHWPWWIWTYNFSKCPPFNQLRSVSYANIYKNIWQKSKSSQCTFNGTRRSYLMKKPNTKKSCDTVPLKGH